MVSATQASSVTLTISGDESHRKAYCYFIILYLCIIYLFVYIYFVFIMRQDSKTRFELNMLTRVDFNHLY